ncbi:hypothetical protein [Helicobacter trogontum]|uniref:hypothetical protein n=1 Tax=Helicobacter trogontum TaxID=50960 RepID=UPI002A911C3C|nr:hypothetical protein [Helicobacter trogontum]MDY5184898.1 hypothetical protein [Helicobacter trogontum]
MRFYFHNLLILFGMIIFMACSDTAADSKTTTLDGETWLFNTQYIRTINETSWEKLSINALNDYTDFKLEFTYISTGKPQTCGLYAKGVVANEAFGNKETTPTKILMRPNLIPNAAIWIIRTNNTKGSIKVEVDDIAAFIKACGDAHQYVVGVYDSTQ